MQTFDLSGFTLVSEFTHICLTQLNICSVICLEYVEQFVNEINAVFLIEIFFSNSVSIDWSIKNSIVLFWKMTLNAALCLVSSAIKISEKKLGLKSSGFILILTFNSNSHNSDLLNSLKLSFACDWSPSNESNAVTLYGFVYSVGPRLFDVSRLYRLSHHRIQKYIKKIYSHVSNKCLFTEILKYLNTRINK